MRRLLLFNLATDADDPVLGFATGWVNRLAAHYDAVEVITMRAGRLAVADNVRVWSVGKERGYSEARRAAEFQRLLRARLSEGRFVACFAHMMPLFAALGAPQLSAAGVRTTLWYAHRSRTRTVQAAVRLVYRVVTSRHDTFPVPTPKLRVIGQGIDTDFFSPYPSASDGTQAVHMNSDVVLVARLMPIKRHDTLIRAVAATPGTRAVFVGDVPPSQDTTYPAQLSALAGQLDASERVVFAGAKLADGVRDAYRGAFAAVNLSPPGLFDKAALEAMSCALPTFVTNPAFDNVLGEDRELLRVRDGDDVDGLAERLRTLQVMPHDERFAIGSRLRKRLMTTDSIETFIPRLVRVLETGEPE
jgi:glycosyltransferase involved in cell wall biosynthesis